MDRRLLEHARGERLIATGRAVLALFAVAVVYLDPDISVPQANLAPIAMGFVVYALVLTAIGWRAPVIAVRGRLVVHVVDFVIFSLFIQLTHASVSPFFIFFLFSLISALVRFGVRGMLVMACVAIATYVALALTDASIRSEPGYLIMRATSLSVATLLLAYVGAYHERARQELAKLAAWPTAALSESSDSVVREALQLARDLVGVPRTALVWEEEEEPWVMTAILDGEDLAGTREAPGFLESIVREEAHDAAFLEDGDREDASVLVSSGQVRRIQGSALTSAGHERFASAAVLSAPVKGHTVTGRIFFFDRDDFQIDDVAVVEIISRLVAARFDALAVAARVRDAAVAEERLRVARDLHDGFLQSLTGAALQLELTDRLLESDPASARERLRDVQRLIEADQRELRALISNLRPDTPRPPTMLPNMLRSLAERFRRQWDLEVDVTVVPPAPELPEGLASEIYKIISEGTVNAAKHSGASRVEVELYVAETEVAIIISDDGRGFPFRGAYSLEELNLEHRGPVSLKERVASLHGDLVLHSGPEGSRIEIRIGRVA